MTLELTDEDNLIKEYLKEINHESDEEVEYLTGVCERVAEYLPGIDWSVDFLRDIHGKWWLIDMGEAYKSWHPSCSKVLSGE